MFAPWRVQRHRRGVPLSRGVPSFVHFETRLGKINLKLNRRSFDAEPQFNKAAFAGITCDMARARHVSREVRID